VEVEDQGAFFAYISYMRTH